MCGLSSQLYGSLAPQMHGTSPTGSTEMPWVQQECAGGHSKPYQLVMEQNWRGAGLFMGYPLPFWSFTLVTTAISQRTLLCLPSCPWDVTGLWINSGGAKGKGIRVLVNPTHLGVLLQYSVPFHNQPPCTIGINYALSDKSETSLPRM